ncbi:hypothetical protein ACM614_23945 [Streptomyces sp. 12297]
MNIKRTIAALLLASAALTFAATAHAHTEPGPSAAALHGDMEMNPRHLNTVMHDEGAAAQQYFNSSAQTAQDGAFGPAY